MEVNLNSYTLSITDVLNKLENITNKTSPGPDMISSYFFINCKFVLAVPLLLLYNLSLSSGCFSSNWKISFVKPIKKGRD